VDAEALTLDDFAYNETTGVVDACPMSHVPVKSERDSEKQKTRVEMSAVFCASCPLVAKCPVQRRKGHYVLEFTDQQRRTASRRAEQETDVFRDRYRKRSGIESTNSGLKNRLGLGRLRVRGRGSVFRVIQHKLAGWNLLRGVASAKLRAVVAQRMSELCPWYENRQSGQLFADLFRVSIGFWRSAMLDLRAIGSKWRFRHS
jgi:hypothetical protein